MQRDAQIGTIPPNKPMRLIQPAAAFLLFAIFSRAQSGHEKRITPVDSAQRLSFEQQPKIAVIVGIGHYPQFSGLSALRYPAHDVELLEAELTHQGYKVVSLKDQEATRGSIEQALRNISDLVAGGSGTVLFFFSGHGFADQGKNYLATYEASVTNLARSGMPVKAVADLLKSTGAPRQIILIDACRSEAGKDVGARSFAALQVAAGLRALLSTKAGHISYEDDALGSGVLTHFLVEGLRGQAAGVDGLITFRDLSDFVINGVSSYGLKSGQMQVPYEAGEASGDFLLARVTGGPPPASSNVNAKDGQRYVWIPPGHFVMGCSPGDNECKDWEKPAHNVSITKGFWLGQTPVSVGAWKHFAAATSKPMPPEPKLAASQLNPGWRDEQQPIVDVNWNESKDFCEWIGGRLPTEAEWEYAARAGGANSGFADHINAWNLYDMLGNVWQWTADWNGATYRAQQEDTDPKGPAEGDRRVIRGGSWVLNLHVVHGSNRNAHAPSLRYYNIGFRCVGEP